MNLKKFFFLIFIIHCSLLGFSLIANAQWTNIGTLSGTGQYPSVSMVNENVAWFAGGNAGIPVIYRTTNGGLNITSIPAPPCNDLTCLYAKSVNECFVG